MSVTGALHSLQARAGVVFIGSVTAVRPTGGTVEIEFAVEQALKGEPTARYVLREWNGLWAGQRRYWVGERALLFLRTAATGGISSPVDGMDGVLPVLPGIDGAANVNVERLRTRLQRASGSPLPGAGAQVSVASLPLLLGLRKPPPGGPSPDRAADQAQRDRLRGKLVEPQVLLEIPRDVQ